MKDFRDAVGPKGGLSVRIHEDGLPACVALSEFALGSAHLRELVLADVGWKEYSDAILTGRIRRLAGSVVERLRHRHLKPSAANIAEAYAPLVAGRLRREGYEPETR